MNLEQKIEAVLFYRNEPVEIKKLAKTLEVSENEIEQGLKLLDQNLKNRGVCIIRTENEVALATAPEMKDLIEAISKEEMSKEIGRAGLETLAIILYNGASARREIDYIRGVNSSFVIRNLAMRGLIEKDQSEKGFKYKPTISLLAHIGIKELKELPNFEAFKEKIGAALEESDGNKQ